MSYCESWTEQISTRLGTVESTGLTGKEYLEYQIPNVCRTDPLTFKADTDAGNILAEVAPIAYGGPEKLI